MRLTDDGGSPAGPGRGCRNDLLLERAWRVAPRASREAVFHLSSGNGHPAGMSEAGAPRKACPGTHGLHGGPLLLVGLDPAVVAASLSARQIALCTVAHIIERKHCNQSAHSALS